jgi:hypothetical protein
MPVQLFSRTRAVNNSTFAEMTRYAHIWLPGYLRDRRRRQRRPPVQRVWVLFADHYEPLWGRADHGRALSRVRTWSERWPAIAAEHHDSAGRPPKYTFFYPEEEYRPELLDPLAAMTEVGIADVEVHLHHDGEGEQNFVDRISNFTETLHNRHGLLRRENGKHSFGFIHGNWALDNSGPNGRHCGLNNELLLLRNLGCYADFTFPAIPHPSQPRLVNAIYWATDDPQRSKSYDKGAPVTPGKSSRGDLMIIPGPLAVNWRSGRLMPRIEIGELAAVNPVTEQRVRLWLRSAPRIGSDVFIKLFAHGAREDNADALLKVDLPVVLQEFARAAKQNGIELYYASAWEIRRAIRAIESGQDPVQSALQLSSSQGSVASATNSK